MRSHRNDLEVEFNWALFAFEMVLKGLFDRVQSNPQQVSQNTHIDHIGHKLPEILMGFSFPYQFFDGHGREDHVIPIYRRFNILIIEE